VGLPVGIAYLAALVFTAVLVGLGREWPTDAGVPRYREGRAVLRALLLFLGALLVLALAAQALPERFKLAWSTSEADHKETMRATSTDSSTPAAVAHERRCPPVATELCAALAPLADVDLDVQSLSVKTGSCGIPLGDDVTFDATVTLEAAWARGTALHHAKLDETFTQRTRVVGFYSCDALRADAMKAFSTLVSDQVAKAMRQK
jgi:hypothetical protein